MRTAEFIKATAKLFDDEDKAKDLLRSHVQRGKLIREDSSIVKLQKFYDDHKRAYDRRSRHRVPHKIEILELDLSAPHGAWGLCSSSDRPPNLDDLEKRKTEPVYVYRPGKRKR